MFEKSTSEAIAYSNLLYLARLNSHYYSLGTDFLILVVRIDNILCMRQTGCILHDVQVSLDF